MSMDVQTTIRLPAVLIERLDKLIPTLITDPDLVAMGKITRSKVLRLALMRGLEILERSANHVKPAHIEPRKTTSTTDVPHRTPIDPDDDPIRMDED